MQATIIGLMAQRTLSQPEKKLKLTVNSQEVKQWSEGMIQEDDLDSNLGLIIFFRLPRA